MARRRRPFDAVQLTLESAQRVASVVRSAEDASPPTAPLRFGNRQAQQLPRQVRAATFSGSWPIGSTKVVTFKNVATATATVQNLSWPISDAGYVNEDCIVGKDGTNWYLVVPKLQAATAVFVTQTQSGQRLVSIAISATLNTNNCSITVYQTPTTASMTLISQTATAQFLRLRVP